MATSAPRGRAARQGVRDRTPTESDIRLLPTVPLGLWHFRLTHTLKYQALNSPAKALHAYGELFIVQIKSYLVEEKTKRITERQGHDLAPPIQRIAGIRR
jgi:hypothetical protein